MGWSNAGWRADQGGWYKNAAAGGGGYTGPGDVVAFNAWWGLRAYNAAKAAAAPAVLDLLDQAGANAITINLLTTGQLDVASINTWVTAHTVTTIKVTRIYDQVGTNHQNQATLANMPALGVTSGPGAAFAALLFTRASSQSMTSGALTGGGAQPYSISTVAERTGTTGSFNTVFGVGGGEILFNNSANGLGGYAGAVLADTTHSADSAWHAAQVLFSGTGSVVVDGNTAVTGSIGAGTITANGVIGNGIGGFLDGRLMEIGIAYSDISANFNSLNTNQHGTSGYNF